MRGDGISDSTDTSSEDDDQYKSKFGDGRRKMIPRPNASAGFWLSCLLPMALAARYVREPMCKPPVTYNMLSIAATGMCVESLCFFLYLFVDTGLWIKLIISFVPGLITTALYAILLQQSWTFGLLWGFAITFCYQNAYIHVMRQLPRCFSFGEAALLVQGLALFLLNTVLALPTIFFSASTKTEFEQLNAIMMCALLFLFVACYLLAKLKWLRKPIGFYCLMLFLLVAVTCFPITDPIPVIALYNFLFSDGNRLLVVFLYFALVLLTITIICWQLRFMEKASTRLRKIFHLLIVLVYVPGLLYQCAFLYIASGVALAIFTVLELIRVLEIPPLANGLRKAFARFSDEKDAGILALTPFSLLIACSLPMWIHPCSCNTPPAGLLPLMAGVLSIGFGDTAASVIGSKYGSIKWGSSKRSLEGTIAFAVVVLLTVFCLNITDVMPMTLSQWIMTIAATLITALVEATTDQIDNLVLPLVFYSIVSFG